RVVGGTLYVVGMLMFGWNILMTWRKRPAAYEVPVIRAARLGPAEPAGSSRVPGEGILGWIGSMRYHRRYEAMPVVFTVLSLVAVVVASLFEILPTFLIKSNVPTIASVKPYTPLELHGRDLYIREGCFNCHSQMIRPLRYETERYGEYSKPGESVYDHPFLWGSRRIGPDLAREGGKYPNLWHVRHFANPREIAAKSIMPSYGNFQTNVIDWAVIPKRVEVMAMLGVPYGDAINQSEAMARAQAKEIADDIAKSGGPTGLEDKEVVAVVAYLQRLGRDIKAGGVAQAPAPAAPAARMPAGGGK
ncbi:MAG: cytochrome-c oxidase, cbb3-type subunit II, partial [Gemmatimonadetes bacterium]|nr:cytochrome-c oxidase, cbb3-type subunit II [Gemmatimonadota bacterium]